ncbi:hypothetical protein L1987_60065 [Smallanthus sonchifolius]|uniref:Uncharacterized protein n=1 Tax=Smallanthus sonchifolius TaxID=185202 RepID=A0ACB9D7G1_9ASTR|nr:hypothetical protein L1987_60065 [Smallanthus sonchifolius]
MDSNKAPRRNDTYVLDMSVATTTDSIPTCLLSKAYQSDSILWHRKLAHINYQKMNYLVKNDLVFGVPKMKFSVPDDCIPCKKGKQHKKSHKSKTKNSIVTPLELLHMDLFGPISIRSIGAETTELEQFLILGLENLFKQKARRIRSDNGSEFKNSKMGLFCLQKRIHHEFNAPYVPQQNGVTERKNMTLVETARTMLADSKLPVTFWAEAVNTSYHVLNRVLTVKQHNKTCYELLNNRKPNLEYLLPFGNPCTLLKVHDVPTKFSAKAIEGTFLGYVANSTTKRVYNKETRQVEEWFHIDCSNRSLPQMAIGPDWAFDYENLFKSFHLPSNISPTEAAVLYDSCQDSQNSGFLPTAVPHSSVPSTSAPDPNAASCSRTQESDSEDENVIFQDSSTDPLIVDEPSNLSQDQEEIPTNLDSGIPVNQILPYQFETTQVDVLSVPEVASIKELKAHPISNIIGDLRDGVQTRSSLDNTCLYTGFKETGVFDVLSHSCFISQVEPKNVEMALSDNNWIEAMQEELAQFDKLKFWNLVDLPKGVYPIGTKRVFQCKKDDRGVVVRNKARLVVQGFNKHEGIDYTEVYAPVARLEAIRLFLAFASYKGFKVFQLDVKSAFLYALYGLHQAPQAWYETLSAHLLENDFVRGHTDSTLFIKKAGGEYLLVQIYVDDIIFGSTNEGLCKEFETIMKSEFEMSAMGELSFFLGLQVNQKEDGFFIHQSKFQAKPKESHLIAVKRIFRYLKGKQRLGLWFPHGSNFEFNAYTDSDFGGCCLDRKSTTGGGQFLDKKLIELVKVHTDDNFADLFTKAFDRTRLEHIFTLGSVRYIIYSDFIGIYRDNSWILLPESIDSHYKVNSLESFDSESFRFLYPLGSAILYLC